LRQRAFGLVLDTPEALPGLSAAGPEDRPDLHITLHPRADTELLRDGAWYRASLPGDNGTPVLIIHAPAEGRDAWRLRYDDGTTFYISPDVGRIDCHWPDSLTLEDTATYLLGPIIGFALRLRGHTILHASCVDIDGEGAVFVGAAGQGKSTLAAAFSQSGRPVLTDDVCLLERAEGRWSVQPAYPRVRLWAPSVEGLFGAEDALPLLTPNWHKRGLDLEGDVAPAPGEPLPIGAVFVLEDRGERAEVEVERVPAKDALLRLVPDVYNRYLTDGQMRGRDFDTLSALVADVPVFSLYRPDEIPRLPDVMAKVIATLGETARARGE
jgi:hypothetical protein